MHLPLHTYGSPRLARMRYLAISARLGNDHPAAQAALGRYYGRSLRAVPQRDSVSPAAIGWNRESVAPGFMNRGERRAKARNRAR